MRGARAEEEEPFAYCVAQFEPFTTSTCTWNWGRMLASVETRGGVKHYRCRKPDCRNTLGGPGRVVWLFKLCHKCKWANIVSDDDAFRAYLRGGA